MRVTPYLAGRFAQAHQGELRTGDKIQLAQSGHGFEMLEDTAFFEVKQGPYPG